MKVIPTLILLGILVWALSEPHKAREAYEILMGYKNHSTKSE